MASADSAGAPAGFDSVVFIACPVVQDMLERLLPADLAARMVFPDYGLHRVPVQMRRSLQEAVDAVEEPSLIVFGYGLCGNGLDGLKAGPHTFLIPRVDDCIPLLLGSHEAYKREFRKEAGTYWLSKGWIESGSHPLKEYEGYVEKYDAETAMWLMDQQYANYRRIAFVAHTAEDMERYRPEALAVAGFCERWGMVYEELLGSDSFMRRLVERVVELVAGHFPERPDPDFLIIRPGGALRQSQFMREQVRYAVEATLRNREAAMTEYGLYLESGTRRRKTMVHVLDLLGCVAQGPTTEEAIDATPAIRALLATLALHGEPADPRRLGRVPAGA